ncbi:hypothetical protein ACQP2F_14140 [Actinoplanes sp. CA-030573]|uniref:hypothetical protein n=1 Tax=Actinoplanes sp. CA-030573 TaxID=3239898 RepID=UPI003D8B336D
MAAIRDAQLLSGVVLDWWPGEGGRTWNVECVIGPYPHEVAAALIRDATADPDEGTALRGRIGDFPRLHSDGEHRAVSVVYGVPVRVRALEPIGEEAHRRTAIGQRRAAEPTGELRPWLLAAGGAA